MNMTFIQIVGAVAIGIILAKVAIVLLKAIVVFLKDVYEGDQLHAKYNKENGIN